MHTLLTTIKQNIAPRLKLLRAATRRYVYGDIMSLAKDLGMEYRDVIANMGPFDFTSMVSSAEAFRNIGPDFDSVFTSSRDFTPPGMPVYFNAEKSVSRFLGQLVYCKRAQVIVELGCFVGWTSAHLAFAQKAMAGAGNLFCVDISEANLSYAKANLERYNLASKVHLLCGDSVESRVLDSLPEKADIIFLDTSHRFPETLNEVEIYSKRLAPGGCLVLHDSISHAGVRKAVAAVRDRFRVLTFATEEGNGVSVFMAPPAGPQ